MAEPVVSVLVPCHNADAYLEETLESVLAQTYRSLEVIAVDDASEDRTASILENYSRRFPQQIRVARNERRRGMGGSRNRALRAARGFFIAPLDSDDLWDPEMVRKRVAALKSRPEAGFVYTGFQAFDSVTGNALPLRNRDLEADGDILEALVVRGNFIANSSAMVRRSALELRSIRWSERPAEHGREDYIMWLRLAVDWPAIRIDEPLLRYRRHGASHSAVQLRGVNPHLQRIAVLESFLAHYPSVRPHLGRSVHRGVAREYLLGAAVEVGRGHRLSAAGDVLRAIRADPREATRTVGYLTGRKRRSGS
jgi:glycosyltransferase involved in cell wall biosynthesis